MIECEFCKKICKTRGYLTIHQRETKYCLEIQGKTKNYRCDHCGKYFTRKQRFVEHTSRICKVKASNYDKSVKNLTMLEEEFEAQTREYEDYISLLKKEYEELEAQFEEHSIESDKYILELESQLKRLTEKTN